MYQKQSPLIQKHHKFWLLISCLFVILFYIFKAVLLPFFIGFIIAYLLTPITDYVEKKGVPRILATNIILFSFLGLLILFGFLFIPIILVQIKDLIHNMPLYLQKIILFLQSNISAHLSEGDTALILKNIKKIHFQDYLASALGGAAGVTKNIFSHLLSGSMGFLSFVTSVIIALVTSFYLIHDWHHLIKTIDNWLPRHQTQTIRNLILKIDKLQSSFIRGQVMVCVIMAIFYISAFEIIGVNNGFVLGLTSGILTFIPYVGASIGFLMTVGIALAQYLPDYAPLFMIMGTFVLGQTIEGYFLIPQMVGGAVKMHPVIIMFALLAFGSLFGIIGMLVAVPVMAAIGVMANFLLEHYMLSGYYKKTS